MLETVIAPPEEEAARARPPPAATPAADGPTCCRLPTSRPRDEARGRSPCAGSPTRTPPKAQAATPKARPRPAAGADLPILTLDRFEQAMQIARLAAERDLPELTFRAVRERPAPARRSCRPTPLPERAPMRLAQRGIDEGSTDPVAPRVVANLVELERLWEEHHAPPAGVYEVLRIAVLPPGRPAEVFLYAPPPNPRALTADRAAPARCSPPGRSAPARSTS